MKKSSIAVLLFCCSGVSVAAVPDGKIEKPFTFNNKVVCLKEIQEQMTPYLKSFEEEGGVKYQYNVKSGLSYKDAIGLRLQINRVDSGLDVRVADLDYYWLQERDSMCQPAYMVLDRSE
ncbi:MULTISPECIES: hypothetical protein [Klebsiella pneumoniae complex]|jgi:hypothetical protein|uniref:Uncharacterized protein n=1 Tax=Klebsiella quasipneumoniae TaxID=1463165 RepID=A0A8H9ZSM7_9ENTR|nr:MULTISPECIES: hypothetical protein [Klebsiella]ELC0923408.1 hypothetical protein [Klebsiella quasipneumoniae]MBC5049164.1 hypothetical protein [Klebsiella quasipneumoniae]MBK2548041.1 hypothetical protein [Klebsiella variicola]MCI4416560.1 hypothetical protein [Klebsiella variicola]MDF3329986.1 hypothetical protein [Klebsiella quasipneumoniae subsp. similipneumoniae]